MDTEENGIPKQERGFRLLPLHKRQEIASMGGKAARDLGRAHRFTSETGKRAVKRREEKRNEARNRRINDHESHSGITNSESGTVHLYKDL